MRHGADREKTRTRQPTGGPRLYLPAFNVYSEAKRREKLNYMHNNPVKRGLVKEPGDCPWSSWRFYFLQDVSLLPMDRLD
jgi:hypothetical protein